jgi:hypothetical protein
MMDCKEATRKIEQLEEGKLGLLGRINLWIHLFLCNYCSRFYKQWRYLGQNFTHHPTVTLDEAQKERLKKAIDRLN